MLGDRGLKCILEKYVCQLDWVQWCAVVSLVMNNQVLYKFGDLYSSPNMIWVIKSRIRWVGHVAYMREQRCASRVLVEKPEGRRPLGRPRLRWEDNIRMDLREVGCGLDGAGSG
jgi:hypothetical protein